MAPTWTTTLTPIMAVISTLASVWTWQSIPASIMLQTSTMAAATLLRLVTLADGLGEVVNAAPESVRAIGQQFINKLTGDETGDGLLQVRPEETATAAGSLADLARLVPLVVRLAGEHVDLEQTKGQSIGAVLAVLETKVSDEERASVAKARRTLAQLPIFNDLPFEELYLRTLTK